MAYEYTGNTNGDKFKFVGTSIKIIGTDPEVTCDTTAPKTTDATISITDNQYCNWAEAVKSSNLTAVTNSEESGESTVSTLSDEVELTHISDYFTLEYTKSGDSNPTQVDITGFKWENVTGEDEVDTGKVTLTADLSGVEAGTTLTLTVTTNALVTTASTPAAISAPITNTITVKAIPAATFDATTGKLTNSDESSAVEYQIVGTDTWTEVAKKEDETNGTSGDLTSSLESVVGDNVNGAAVDPVDAITVRWASDADSRFYQTIQVGRQAQPSDLSINYTTEKITNFTSTTEYISDSGETYASLEDNSTELSLSGDTLMGKTITYRTAASNANLASGTKTLSVPERPVISITTENVSQGAYTTSCQTLAAVTLTTEGNAAVSEALYGITDTNAASVTTNLTSELSNAPKNGTGNIIFDATSAQYINVYIPAKENEHFASGIASVKGLGNTYATVESVIVQPGDKTVTLKIKGDTWKADTTNGTSDGSVSGVSITKSGEQNPVSDVTFKIKDYGETGCENNELVVTLTGTDAAFKTGETYTVTFAAGTANTTSGRNINADSGDNQNKTTVSVANNGYKVTLKTKLGTDAGTAVNFEDTIVAANGSHTFSPNGLGEYEKLTDVKISNNAGGTVELGTAESPISFTYTAPSETPSGIVDVEITLTVAPDPYELTVNTDVAVSHTKSYDGTTAATDPSPTFNITFPNDYDDVTSNVTLSGTVTYTSKDAGTTTVDLTDLALSGENAIYFTLDKTSFSNKALTAETGASSGITAATLPGVTIGDITVTGTTQEAIVNAIQSATVNIGEIESGTVSKLLPGLTEETIGNLVDAAVVAAGVIQHDEVESTITESSGSYTASAVTARQGDAVTFSSDDLDGYTLTSAADGSGDTITGISVEDGKLVVGTGASTTTSGNETSVTLTFTGTNDDGNTDTKTVTLSLTVNAAEPDYDSVSGTPLSITLDSNTIKNALYKLSDNTSSNYDTTSYSGSATFTVTPRKRSSATTGFTVYADGKGYGTVVSDPDVNSDGTINALPEVTDVVRGAVFVGWSEKENGTIDTIIDPETAVLEDGETIYAVYQGYMTGVSSTKMDPNGSTTRAQLLRMLLVSAGLYDASIDYGDPTFSDASGEWYSKYIACAENLQKTSGAVIVAGYSDGTFRPNQIVTREEAAAFIARVMGVEVIEDATNEKLSDFGSVQDWAKKYVAAMSDNGTITGYAHDDGTYTFEPQKNIARGESANMINKYLGLTLEEKAEIKADASVTSPYSDVTSDRWDYADLMFASLNVKATYYQTSITIPTA